MWRPLLLGGGKLGRPGRLNAAASGLLLYADDTASRRRFLVDTGASFSLLPHRSTAPPSGTQLTGPTGTAIRCWGEVEQQLTLAGRPYRGRFIKAAVSFPILGIDFLRQHGFSVDVPGNRLVNAATGDAVPLTVRHSGPTAAIAVPALQATPAHPAALSSPSPQPTPAPCDQQELGGPAPLVTAAQAAKATNLKLPLVHVPHSGPAALQTALLSGIIPVAMDSITSALPQINAGKMIPLAVTAAKRSPSLPNVPTAAEAGLGSIEIAGWMGLHAPKGTPDNVIQKLNAELNRVLQLPEVRQQLATRIDITGGTPASFAAYIKGETERLNRITQDANLKFE